MCTRLYVIPLPSTCSKLWDHFKYRNPLIHQPWMLLRDFDEIIYPTEQCGGFFPNARANVFGSMIDVCFLFDVYSISSFFTWQKRCRNNVIISRMLDKCLTSDTWKNMFPNAYVEVLCRMHSNHNPLFLRCDRQENRGVKPFKFEATWTTHPQYKIVVARAWGRHFDDATKYMSFWVIFYVFRVQYTFI